MTDWREIVNEFAEEHDFDAGELLDWVFDLEMESVSNDVKNCVELSLSEQAKDRLLFEEYLAEVAESMAFGGEE